MSKTMSEQNQSELREQLEEFALHIKPGTTKGKHRTGIFDTYELAKLVKALIHQAEKNAVNEFRREIVESSKKGHELVQEKNAELERGSDG